MSDTDIGPEDEEDGEENEDERETPPMASPRQRRSNPGRPPFPSYPDDQFEVIDRGLQILDLR